MQFGSHPGASHEILRIPPLIEAYMDRIKRQIGQRCQPFVQGVLPSYFNVSYRVCDI